MSRPRTVMVVQARMGSTRLPGKSMMPLAGEPLVGRILERLKRCRSVDETVLATTGKPEDDVLAALAGAHGIEHFRGAESDLVDRCYRAAERFGAEIVVRFPADNPCPEPEEIDRIVEAHAFGERQFTSNLSPMLDNGYPDGIGAEVFDFTLLADIWRSCDDPWKREHLHLSVFDYKTQTVVDPDRYAVKTIPCPAAFRRPDLILDVNTEEEYAFMTALYDHLYPRNPRFHITDIIAWRDGVYRPARPVG